MQTLINQGKFAVTLQDDAGKSANVSGTSKQIDTPLTQPGSRPVRIQRKRTKGWKMPANTVYVGRPGPWGNPFRACLPADAVRAYQRWMRGEADLHRIGIPPTREEIAHLTGKNLACWCRLDQPCHADILLEIANR